MKLWTDDGRTDDGRTPDHGHPISSPREPNSSGELIIRVATPNCTKKIVTRSECCSNFDINFYNMTLKVVYSVMVSL